MGPLGAISEAHRRRDTNLWDTAHRTRLNNKRTGAIILVSQRLHQDDLIGHALKAGQWEVLTIPAICTEEHTYRTGPRTHNLYRRIAGDVLHPDREPREVLEEMRLAIGSMNFSAQYQQDPVPPGGNIIKREWLKSYETAPEQFDRVVVSWDTASTIGDNSNYSVGTVWGSRGTDFFLLDLARGKFEVPDLRRRILQLSDRWEADSTLIEDTELGCALQQDLAQSNQLRPLLRRARYDKEARLLAQSARFEAGQVHLPATAAWLAVYVAELLAFPTGRNDNQVDSTSQALEYMTSVSRSAMPIVRREVRRRNVVRRPEED